MQYVSVKMQYVNVKSAVSGSEVIVISLPGGWSFYTLVSGVARHQCARPHPREGYNYYITCYLGNITVQERYGQHSYMLPG